MLYGIIGFVIGFVIGLIINAGLLRGVPREKYLANNSLRLRFGLLNWGVAIIGLIIGLNIH